jgi:hypothetical protein
MRLQTGSHLENVTARQIEESYIRYTFDNGVRSRDDKIPGQIIYKVSVTNIGNLSRKTRLLFGQAYHEQFEQNRGDSK